MRYWKRVDKNGKTILVENYSHDLDIEGAIEIDKAECNAFIASLPAPIPVPVRDLGAEIDELRAKVEKLEVKVSLET